MILPITHRLRVILSFLPIWSLIPIILTGWEAGTTRVNGFSSGPRVTRQNLFPTDIQGVRFISLDSYPLTDLELYVDDYPMEKLEEDLRKQAEWLENLLKDNPNQWTVLVFQDRKIVVK